MDADKQGDAYDAEQKSLAEWKENHDAMYAESWISGTTSLYFALPCRHYKWKPAEVYRGDFTKTLKHPLLLIGSPYVSTLSMRA
jgi:hypothetical protein